VTDIENLGIVKVRQ